jgi:hypothetical protein
MRTKGKIWKRGIATMHTRRRFLAEALAPLIVATPAGGGLNALHPRSEAPRIALQRLCRHKGRLSGNLSCEPRSGRLWIACVAVVFAVYGYVIKQRRIAQEAYGDFDKVTMDSGLAVLKPLERTWKDDDSVGHSLSLSVLRSRS